MSSPESPRKIVLSPRARQDFIEILRFTGETWGHGQVSIYRDKIDDALQLIGRNPGMGHRSSDLPETHRVYFVGSHVIVYRDQDTCVAVVRILHQRMSLVRHV
jgi:toxin ParE1/3/4